MINPGKKMRAFFWKPFIIDPTKEEHKDIVWQKVVEHKITPEFQELVVEAYHDPRAVKAAAAAASGDIIKVTGPEKKKFFSPEESKNVQMSLPKFPKKHDDIIDACLTYQEGLISKDQIGALARAWPKDSNLVDLYNTEVEENEIWDKAEAYMINLSDQCSLYDRLKVWDFLNEWPEDKAFMEVSIKQMTYLFGVIESQKTFYEVLGMALAMGNIINGGTNKGQCDGFDIQAVDKLQTTKDNSNKTMLSFITTKLVEEKGDEIIESFKTDNKAFATKATDCTSLINKQKEIAMRLDMT